MAATLLREPLIHLARVATDILVVFVLQDTTQELEPALVLNALAGSIRLLRGNVAAHYVL